MLSKVALLLVLMILSSNQIMCSHGRPDLMMMHRRHLLSHSDEAARKGTMTGGTLSPDVEEGKAKGVLGNVKDVRPTTPGHSPGAGHAATNNGVGRKLLGVN